MPCSRRSATSPSRSSAWSSTITTRMAAPPARWSRPRPGSRPSGCRRARLTRWRRPIEPGAGRVGAARPVVADLDDQPVRRWSASSTRRRRAARRAWRRWSAPRPRRSRRRSRPPAAGRRMIDALTVTGICARRPSASTAATRPRSASTGGAMPRARSRSSPMAAPASSRALRTSSATSGRSSRRSSARPSCMLSATSRAWAPSCRSRSMRRSSAACTSRAPAPRARELVDAGRELALLRAQAGQGDDDDRVGAEGEGERGDGPQRPERAAAGEYVDRDEHGRDPARRRAMEGERPQSPVGHTQRRTHRELDRERQRQREDHPLRPEVPGPGQPPDEDQHEAEQQREGRLDRDRGAPDVFARAISVHGHSVPGAHMLVPDARPPVTLRLAGG